MLCPLVVTNLIFYKNGYILFLSVSDSFHYVVKFLDNITFIKLFETVLSFYTTLGIKKYTILFYHDFKCILFRSWESILFWCLHGICPLRTLFILQRAQESDVLFLGADSTFLQGNRTPWGVLLHITSFTN